MARPPLPGGVALRWRDPRLWWLLAGTAATLLAGYGVKARCVEDAWPGEAVRWDNSQYSEYCYSDLPPLYHARGLHDDAVPYVEAFNEYPAVTGLYMYAVAAMTETQHTYFILNAVLLSLTALATTALLADLAGRRTWLWALSPPLLLYAFHNWDLLAVLCTTLGLWFHRRGAALAAGVTLAVGLSAKVWPGLLLPMLGLAILRRDGGLRRDGWRFGLGAVGTVLAIHLPLLARNADGVLATYRFHGERGPTYESPYTALRIKGSDWGWDGLVGHLTDERLRTYAMVASAAALVLLGVLVWLRRLTGAQAGFGAVLAFLLASPVFSVQYVLWLVPFLVLLRVDGVRIWALFATDLWVHLTLFRFFGVPGVDFDQVALAVAARAVALLALLSWVGEQAWRARRTAGPEGDATAPRPAPGAAAEPVAASEAQEART